jgi:predicted enzyme related to lactoylglutathione lyase
MQIIDKFMMLHIAVNDMPKAKEFYAEKLGLEVSKDFRMGDNNWWVELAAPGGVAITLTTHHDHMKPGTLTLYFGTSDIQAAHKQLQDEGIDVTEVKDDLHGPGSGTKWFNFHDTEGNLVHFEQI